MSGADMFDITGYDKIADREGLVIAYPDGEGATPWNGARLPPHARNTPAAQPRRRGRARIRPRRQRVGRARRQDAMRYSNT